MKESRFPENLYYLAARLPAMYGYRKMLLEVLNAKNLRSAADKPYNLGIINNVVRGMHQDENVRVELEKIVSDYQEKKRAEQEADRQLVTA